MAASHLEGPVFEEAEAAYRSGHRGLNIPRGPRSSSFWAPRNLFNHIDRQARTGDTTLVRSGEMTGRKKYIGPIGSGH